MVVHRQPEQALLPDPDLLMLDEPTNGLDPVGIVEIRNLLMDLGAGGKTVFVSSLRGTQIATPLLSSGLE